MKYIDAEKLKAHIQYLIKKDNYEFFDVPELLSFIDSHQQEQPEVDLEKEFADFLEKENAYVDDNNKISYYNGSSFDHTCDIYPIARHFAQWGYLRAAEKYNEIEYNRQRAEESVPNDLEEKENEK